MLEEILEKTYALRCVDVLGSERDLGENAYAKGCVDVLDWMTVFFEIETMHSFVLIVLMVFLCSIDPFSKHGRACLECVSVGCFLEIL